MYILSSADLPIGDNGVLRKTTITVLGLLCVLKYCNSVVDEIGYTRLWDMYVPQSNIFLK